MSGANFLIGFVGFFAGTIFCGAVARWLGVLWEVARKEQEDGSRRFSFSTAAAISAFHAGPWSILVVGFIAYQVAAEPWWPWFLGGALIGATYMSFIVALTLRRYRNAA